MRCGDSRAVQTHGGSARIATLRVSSHDPRRSNQPGSLTAHSIQESIKSNQINLSNDDFTECFPKNLKDSLEKAKKTYELIQKNETNIKDYLMSLAVQNYDPLKYKNQKQYCLLYTNLTRAYLKTKSFMQSKIVIEDLFLSLTQ